MRAGFYPKLAAGSIRKNKRLYFPYILTGGVMVMMYYILGFLTESPTLENMPGGSVLMTMLPMGCGVIALFSLLFLFYSNSFLIKQRYREFGLYNILGMDKRNINRIMLWETIFTSVIAVVAGLICGIALSKAAELVLLNMLDMEISFKLSVGLKALRNTIIVFGIIYLLILISSLIKVRRSRPLELMQEGRVGEKVLKRTWIFALAGVIILGIAYYLAISIEEPITALFAFFAAVLLVIVGTYLLFISGSVAFCRLLQKNKKYYYKPNHFVSVSSMVYRMKRNGAGLASICILLTMVLVMLSSSASLYFGEEDSLQNRYPNNVNIKVSYSDISGISDENIDMLSEDVAGCMGDGDYNADSDELMGLRTCVVSGMFTKDGILLDPASAESFSDVSYDNLGYMYVMSIEDYNNRMDENKTLEDDECLIYYNRLETQWKTFKVEYGNTYKVKERLDEYRVGGDEMAMTMPCVYFVVNDLGDFIEPMEDLRNSVDQLYFSCEWSCSFDTDSVEEELAAADNIKAVLAKAAESDASITSFYVHSRQEQRDGFYEMYGSLFFLGIMLSIVFLMAAVMIIYYKQISEGYEDSGRFEIMQKVGMTKRDIKKSINSQMLTVFFAPLVMAGIHLAFAYPFISKIMLMFAFDNTMLNIMVTAGCFVVFGVFYAVVYKITSSVYYNIVSGKEK